jgi:membrane protein implicated in regulation of membrane protease activity
MLWWQWVVLGVVLLGAEMIVDAEFYLVFLGVSAVTVGLVDLAWPGSPIWAEWLLFSVVAVAAVLLFRSTVYKGIRGSSPDLEGGLVGDVGVIESDIEAGAMGRITLRGTTWTAHNIGEVTLAQNARARIEGVSGVTVDVRSTDEWK